MDHAIPTINDPSRPLIHPGQPDKPKMLVVDDEPDNLDLLYRTFRRDFRVLRAESGSAALEILATEGEVAVIISDQRMPEMKGTEFLSKTVPQFPNTMRIILTGFTDVEDLVEAINSGQVYKYITKPWNPSELKAVVQRAAETYELLRQRTEELQRAQTQTVLLTRIVQTARQSDNPTVCLAAIAAAFSEAFAADGCLLQLVERHALTANQSSCGILKAPQSGDDPLIEAAIATQTMQSAFGKVQLVLTAEQSDCLTRVVVPIVFQDDVLAVLSLQWQQPYTLREDQFALLHLAAQQAALALVCTRCHKIS